MLAKLAKATEIAGTPGLWRYAGRGIAPTVEHTLAIAGLPISTCIDVGANKGQFSALVAHLHPRAAILAFEPMPEACRKYRAALPVSRARLFETCIGRENGMAEFHVTNRADSSSLLRPGEGQERAFNVHGAATISVPVRRLDDVLTASDLVRPCLMKIDVQGTELDVLSGAANLLPSIDYIYVELSYIELYEGQPLASDVLTYLFGNGYRLRGVYNQVLTHAFGATQADFLLCHKT